MNQASKISGVRMVFGYLGFIVILIGITLLLPLVTLLFYPEEAGYAKYFILPGLSAVLLGYLLSFFVRNTEKGALHKNQSAFIVVLAWILAILFAALPFVLSGSYTFTQAMFEATSGWSTTGLSIVNVTAAPKIFLIHRSLMLLFGGVGLVLVMLAVLNDSHGMRLYNSEGHSDKLLPNLLRSVRLILALYLGFIVFGTVAYVFFGMSWFDAINHSIAAVATGGFSTQPDSIGHYNSVPIEVVSIILMILGSINFMAHVLLFKGNFRKFFRTSEMKATLSLLISFSAIGALFYAVHTGSSLLHSLRIAVFQVVSAFSTTGFQTVPAFIVWPPFLLLLLSVAMTIGGQSGSTSGGIKQSRFCIAAKDILWNLRDTFSNEHVIRADYIHRPSGDDVVGQRERAEVNTFILVYLIVLAAGCFILTAYGYRLDQSLFEFSSAMACAGLSAGITSPDAPAGVLWTLNVGMFVGRLEIYVVVISMMHMLQNVRNRIRYR